MSLENKIKEIKTKFRLSMNGAVSQSMREKGIEYKINFGIELPRLKAIAAEYDKDHELAQFLWKENIRESKILACLLQPVDTFYSEIADIWVEDIRYPELAEMATMLLFQYLPYAPAKVFEWMADEREMFQGCGFLLAARLFMQGLELNERSEAEFLDQAQAALESEPYFPRKAAILSLKKYALTSGLNSKKVNELIIKYKSTDNPQLKSAYEEIKAETEYLQ